jgi:hypothetical protein
MPPSRTPGGTAHARRRQTHRHKLSSPNGCLKSLQWPLWLDAHRLRDEQLTSGRRAGPPGRAAAGADGLVTKCEAVLSAPSRSNIVSRSSSQCQSGKSREGAAVHASAACRGCGRRSSIGDASHGCGGHVLDVLVQGAPGRLERRRGPLRAPAAEEWWEGGWVGWAPWLRTDANGWRPTERGASGAHLCSSSASSTLRMSMVRFSASIRMVSPSWGRKGPGRWVRRDRGPG